MSKEVDSIRNKAVSQHHKNVDYFKMEYDASSSSPYASAFTYGRKKLDENLYAFINEAVPMGGHLLDVGCGTGEYLKNLSQKGYKCYGVEPAESMRDQAQLLNPGISIKDATIDQLPFENNTFDFVMAIEVLRYLHPADIASGYREIFRVLKPGGSFYVSHVNRLSLDGFLLFNEAQKLFPSKRRQRPYCHFTGPVPEMDMIRKAGFEKILSSSAMLAPLRMIYKISQKAGAQVSKLIEPLDEITNKKQWHQKFAGHLMFTARKPS